MHVLMATGFPYQVWHLLSLNNAPVAIRGQVQGENITPITLLRGRGSARDGSTREWVTRSMESPVGKDH